jgi:ribose transport system permease protein
MADRSQSIFKKFSGLSIGLFLLLTFFCILAPGFFTVYNLLNLLKASAVLIIVSFGMYMAILSGQIDMSVGSVMSLAGVTTGLCLQHGAPMAVGIGAGLLVGVVIGALNGYFIGKQHFDFWVVTFATMGIAQGLALVLTNGNVVPGFADTFRFLGDGKVGGIYFIIWFTVLICFLINFIMEKTKYGYQVFSVGGDPQCARFTGIRVSAVRLRLYIFSGVLAAVAGIFLASKTNSASPIAGTGYEFDAIAAVVIGGTPFEGGKGTVKGTITGGLLITVLRNGLNLMGLTTPVQFTAIGLIIMIIIIVDVLKTKRNNQAETRRKYATE